MTTATPATAPAAGLLASLNVRVWLDHTPDSRQFALLLLTHPPARRRGESTVTIECGMQLVADSLGALPCDAPLPYVGDRVTIRDGGLMLVRFDGGGTLLRVRKLARLATVLETLGQVVITVGLDPLDPLAHGPAVDDYLTYGATADRLRCALAGVEMR